MGAFGWEILVGGLLGIYPNFAHCVLYRDDALLCLWWLYVCVLAIIILAINFLCGKPLVYPAFW